MPHTYTRIHLHIVFVVKFRKAVILDSWKTKLYKYITGIIQNHHHKMIIINGVEDHLHLLIGMRPTQSISELLQNIKRDSTNWINHNQLTLEPFAWQEGYGAFSYGKNDLSSIISYIEKQEEHHTKFSFREEYVKLLVETGTEYEEQYLFYEPV